MKQISNKYQTNIKQIYSGKIVILKIPEGDGIDTENYEKYSTAMYCSSLVENIRSEGDEKNLYINNFLELSF